MIATHLTPDQLRVLRGMVQEEADTMTEEEIWQKCQECIAEADKWSKIMIHDKKMQDPKDKADGRWVLELGELAAAWSMSQPGKQAN